eukprot:TRINITY_DN13476_c0_g1_i2.p1 TRINITY_DN13476_c0_g1~~TRINITY_DN13476_c0_g1_i2.p1  ORF type:complete len:808 (+),score=186.47 TRINITY_DN13476_c0_g1_i2:280-2424(+)
MAAQAESHRRDREVLSRQSDKYRKELEASRQSQMSMANELQQLRERLKSVDQDAWRRRAEAAESHLQQAKERTGRLETQLEKAKSAKPQPLPASASATPPSALTTHLHTVVAGRAVRPHLSRDLELPVLNGDSADYHISVANALQSQAGDALQQLGQGTQIHDVIGGVLRREASLVSVYSECLVPVARLAACDSEIPQQLLSSVSAGCSVLMDLLRIEPPGVGGLHLSAAVFDQADVLEYEAEVQELCLAQRTTSTLVPSNLPSSQQGWLVDTSRVADQGVLAFGPAGRAWDALTTAPTAARVPSRDALCPSRAACTAVDGGVSGLLRQCVEKLAVSGRTRADVAASLVHVMCKAVLTYDDAVARPLPRMSCGLLHQVSALHLLFCPPLRSAAPHEEAVFQLSPSPAYRGLQAALFQLELSLLRAFAHLPATVEPQQERLLLRYLYSTVKKPPPFASLRRFAVDHAANALKRLQDVASRFEAGPNAAASRTSEALVTHSRSNVRLSKESLRVSLNTMLVVQAIVQNEEYKELRGFVFAHPDDLATPPRTDTEPVSPSRKRRLAQGDSPRKRMRTDAVDDEQNEVLEGLQATKGAERLAMVTFFRVAELAQNLVVLLKAAAWHRHTGSQEAPQRGEATEDDLAQACIQCIVTLHLLLPHCTNFLHDYSHVLSSPVTMLLEYATSPDFKRHNAGPLAPIVRDAIQNSLTQVQATCL